MDTKNSTMSRHSTREEKSKSTTVSLQRMRKRLFRLRHTKQELLQDQHEVVIASNRSTTLDDFVTSNKLSLRDIACTFNENMVHLSIHNCSLNRRFVKKFEENQKNFAKLTTLSLNNNHFYRQKTTFRRLLQNLPPNLQQLSLCWNGITAQTCPELAIALERLPTLSALRLCGNPIGGNGLEILLQKGNLHLIETVDLCDCDIHDEVSLLAEYLSKPTSIVKHLALKMNGIGEQGAKRLAQGLRTNHSLKDLQLHCNEITDQGAEAIMQALSYSGASRISELSLCANRITEQGAKVIARSLNQTPFLCRLYLDHNYLGDNGVQHFVSWLVNNATLQELTLASNNLTNKSVQAMAIALETNTCLQTLSLSGNSKVDRRGASSFVKTLASNKHLSTLFVLEENYENHLLNNKLDYLLVKNDLRNKYMSNLKITHGAWPFVLSHIGDVDKLYVLLQGRPDLVPSTKQRML